LYVDIVIEESEVDIIVKRRWMIDRKRFGIKERKSICAKEQRVKSGNYPVIL